MIQPPTQNQVTQITFIFLCGCIQLFVAFAAIYLMVVLLVFAGFITQTFSLNSYLYPREPFAEAVNKKLSDFATDYVEEHCEFPPAFRSHPTTGPPSGGKKLFPEPDPNSPYAHMFVDPMRFSHSAQPFMGGEALRIESRADFNPGGAQSLYYVMMLKSDDCSAEVVERGWQNRWE